MFRLIARIVACSLCLGIIHHAHAETGLASPIPETQRLFIENNNLPAEAFFAMYMSKILAERRYAEMYLLGVLDATEGRAWCDYHQFKTVTLGEVVHEGLKKMDAGQRGRRAAYVISDILNKQFPCKDKHQ